MSCGVGCRRGLGLALLWLWCWPVATARIRPLAWEPPFAVGMALEKAKRQTNKQTNKQKNSFVRSPGNHWQHFIDLRLCQVVKRQNDTF